MPSVTDICKARRNSSSSSAAAADARRTSSKGSTQCPLVAADSRWASSNSAISREARMAIASWSSQEGAAPASATARPSGGSLSSIGSTGQKGVPAPLTQVSSRPPAQVPLPPVITRVALMVPRDACMPELASTATTCCLPGGTATVVQNFFHFAGYRQDRPLHCSAMWPVPLHWVQTTSPGGVSCGPARLLSNPSWVLAIITLTKASSLTPASHRPLFSAMSRITPLPRYSSRVTSELSRSTRRLKSQAGLRAREVHARLMVFARMELRSAAACCFTRMTPLA
mmetsp:Transcript_138267/g.311549  ORF Transcript_138267/g.311549 Transcript_138267/m.311549 type:complete len:284 (-) Transcript_138267:1571-2422(-)